MASRYCAGSMVTRRGRCAVNMEPGEGATAGEALRFRAGAPAQRRGARAAPPSPAADEPKGFCPGGAAPEEDACEGGAAGAAGAAGAGDGVLELCLLQVLPRAPIE